MTYNIRVRHLLLILLSITISSCSKLPVGQAELLFKVENRDISEDRITEYRFFKSGLVNITNIHNTSENENLYKSEFKKLKKSERQKIQQFQSQLQALEYHNDFPWKEKLHDRGDVVRIEFPSIVQLQALKPSQEQSSIKVPKVFFYYAGHKDSPELFKNILEFSSAL